MSDVVVTVPKGVWFDWIAEGDAVGESDSGEEWGYFMGGRAPSIVPGERVYVVAHGRIRGYAPLVRVAETERGFALCRKGGAVAVTIPTPVPGFRGWRTRWWNREVEIPFPTWAFEGVVGANARERDEVARHRRAYEEAKPIKGPVCHACKEVIFVTPSVLASKYFIPPYLHDGCAGWPHCACRTPHQGNCIP